ncbi:MAG: Gfo/Idh/MocA family oxidoreductase [Chloroflexi bacterium]|nr:Gfo/Idh/MocA family oxidoreductase [Chloroflexota bacterium]
MEPIRVGVVGLGGRGLYLARAFDADPRVRVVAVCDRDAARLERARRVLGEEGRQGYAELADMLADPAVQAVVVATHDAAHGANGLDVLRARKHLFLEKPMAQTIEECDAMISAWEGSGVVFMVGLELRYCSLCEAMRQDLDAGTVGDVRIAYAVDNVSVGGNYYYHGPKRRQEYVKSLVLEKGTHTLDLMNWFIGAHPQRVYAEGSLDVFGGDAPNDKRCRDCDEADTCPYYVAQEFKMDYGEVLQDKEDLCVYAQGCDTHDNSLVTVWYDNGSKMSYVECHFTPDYSREFTLIGTKGRMYGFYNNEQDFRIETTYRHSSRKDVVYPERRPGGHGGGDPRIQDEFLRLVQAGEPACPGVLGARNSAAIAIASHEAILQGRPIDVPPVPVSGMPW